MSGWAVPCVSGQAHQTQQEHEAQQVQETSRSKRLCRSRALVQYSMLHIGRVEHHQCWKLVWHAQSAGDQP
eukprot:1142405-Pelagomonas_calceolata.AAC.5